MLEVVASKRFDKDIRLAKKRGLSLRKLEKVVDMLACGKPLPASYKDHKLVGNYEGYRECHIQPDWLLIYRTDPGELFLFLFRTGTHSDLL